MNWDWFHIGVWHPFGPHGIRPDGEIETAEQILERKANELKSNGWTLWSFQNRNDLIPLQQILQAYAPQPVYVLCSDSTATKPPSGAVQLCRDYQLPGSTEWHRIPPAIRIPHPIGTKTHASSFIVRQVIPLADVDRRPSLMIEWLSTRTGLWNKEYYAGKIGYPPRPEMLIRRSVDGAPVRPVRAILELTYPFFATLRRSDDRSSHSSQ